MVSKTLSNKETKSYGWQYHRSFQVQLSTKLVVLAGKDLMSETMIFEKLPQQKGNTSHDRFRHILGFIYFGGPKSENMAVAYPNITK